MQYYFAPMEGVNGFAFRRVHRRFFPGVDKYFTPFLSPSQHHVLGRREYREICPENNQGVPVVPQLLTKRGEDFAWCANLLWDMGYREVNLNLGCPSGTVTAKGKGSGFLAHREELKTFLDVVFAQSKPLVSIKTRLGLTDPEEFGPILELYNRYPIHELTIHPRVQKDFYKHPARREEFSRYAPASKNPLCYNGDLVTGQDCLDFAKAFPGVPAVMLGRGLVANPAVVTCLQGGQMPDKACLKAFHDALYEEHAQAFESRKNAMLRMKEIWFYQIHLFEEGEKLGKQIKKATDCATYERVVEELFDTLELRREATPGWA